MVEIDHSSIPRTYRDYINTLKDMGEALGCSSDEVEIVMGEVDATHCIEGGKILPIPGSPEEAAWKKASES
ncbi:MAG: hypothetical protein AB4038_11025 [Prochloraceae cyanobacterium]